MLILKRRTKINHINSINCNTIHDRNGILFHKYILNIYRELNSGKSREKINITLSQIKNDFNFDLKNEKNNFKSITLNFSSGLIEEIFLNFLEMNLDFNIILERISFLDKTKLFQNLYIFSEGDKKNISISQMKKRNILLSNIVRIFLSISDLPDSIEKMEILNHFSRFTKYHYLNGSFEIGIQDIFARMNDNQPLELPFDCVRDIFKNLFYSSYSLRENYLQNILNEMDSAEEDRNRLKLLISLSKSTQLPFSKSMFDYFLLRARLNKSVINRIITLTSLASINKDFLTREEFISLIFEAMDSLENTEFEFSDENPAKHLVEAVIATEDLNLLENILEFVHTFIFECTNSDYKLESYLSILKLLDSTKHREHKFNFFTLVLYELDGYEDLSYKSKYLHEIIIEYCNFQKQNDLELEIMEILLDTLSSIATDISKPWIEELFYLADSFYLMNDINRTLSIFREAFKKSLYDDDIATDFYFALSNDFHFLNPKDLVFESHLITVFNNYSNRYISPQEKYELIKKFTIILLKNKNLDNSNAHIFQLLEYVERLEDKELIFKIFPEIAENLRTKGMVLESIQILEKMMSQFLRDE